MQGSVFNHCEGSVCKHQHPLIKHRSSNTLPGYVLHVYNFAFLYSTSLHRPMVSMFSIYKKMNTDRGTIASLAKRLASVNRQIFVCNNIKTRTVQPKKQAHVLLTKLSLIKCQNKSIKQCKSGSCAWTAEM